MRSKADEFECHGETWSSDSVLLHGPHSPTTELERSIEEAAVTQVLPFLYLGNAKDAQDKSILEVGVKVRSPYSLFTLSNVLGIHTNWNMIHILLYLSKLLLKLSPRLESTPTPTI